MRLLLTSILILTFSISGQTQNDPWEVIQLTGVEAKVFGSAVVPLVITTGAIAAGGTAFILLNDDDGKVDSSDVIVPEDSCSFDWQGKVEVMDADCGLLNGAATISKSSSEGFQFLWSTDTTGTSISDLSPGSYFVIVTDLLTSCVDTVDFSIDKVPSEYLINSEIIPGFCGEVDNLILDLDVSVPLNIQLSGSTTGLFQEITSSPIVVGDLTSLNAGQLIIDIWTDESGSDCAQQFTVELESSQMPLLSVENVIHPEPPEFVGSIELLISQVEFPVDIIVNGELFMTTTNPQVILEGLPPGFYKIFVVDQAGCGSEPVFVELIIKGVVEDQNRLQVRPSLSIVLGGDRFLTENSGLRENKSRYSAGGFVFGTEAAVDFHFNKFGASLNTGLIGSGNFDKNWQPFFGSSFLVRPGHSLVLKPGVILLSDDLSPVSSFEANYQLSPISGQGMPRCSLGFWALSPETPERMLLLKVTVPFL